MDQGIGITYFRYFLQCQYVSDRIKVVKSLNCKIFSTVNVGKS